jgi:hypothetical protein
MHARVPLLFLVTILMPPPAFAQTPALNDLPAGIRPASNLAVYREAYAVGVQIYTCGKDHAGEWAWIFKAPEAVLVDAEERPLGKHYAGPSWEGFDGGKVVGAVKASAPSPDNSIPWLLLDIKSREGQGDFTHASAILRVSTRGGLTPSGNCDEAHAGSEQRVPYTATYLFLK